MSERALSVAIAGSRGFGDYAKLEEVCDAAIARWLDAYGADEVVIISGMARGADALACDYAKAKGYAIREFPADWDRLGKAAGFMRNRQMASAADCLVAFWDGDSKGTAHMIRACKDMRLSVVVYDYVRGMIAEERRGCRRGCRCGFVLSLLSHRSCRRGQFAAICTKRGKPHLNQPKTNHMKAFRSKQGFLLIKLTASELMDAQNSGYAICDYCATPALTGYYVPVLNQWLCDDCCKKWIEGAEYYPEDADYEIRHFDRMIELLGFDPNCVKIAKLYSRAPV